MWFGVVKRFTNDRFPSYLFVCHAVGVIPIEKYKPTMKHPGIRDRNRIYTNGRHVRDPDDRIPAFVPNRSDKIVPVKYRFKISAVGVDSVPITDVFEVSLRRGRLIGRSIQTKSSNMPFYAAGSM
ncbi:MAG: hypothetical protein CMJ78_10105 [Planctomycetaceae bacterium]|nr:hypothetical protein [Planctomycetaceae bacterium]